MKPLKISIATPSFNQGSYIEKAIISVLAQDYPDFEHIIFDNCSTDETLNVISKYPHVKLVSEPDKGQSDALNKAFLAATGDVIGWLNADDYYMPDTFRKVNEHFQKYDVDALYSHVHYVDKDEHLIRNLRTHSPVRWMSLLYTFIQSTTFFFKADIVRQDKHLLENELQLCMDMEYFARLLHAGYKFRHVNDYFASFRWHETNKSKPVKETLSKNTTEGFFILNKILKKALSPTPGNVLLYKLAINLLARPVRRTMVLMGL
jgi:glycosyltransferase involved in cell wall biosynthesis